MDGSPASDSGPVLRRDAHVRETAARQRLSLPRAVYQLRSKLRQQITDWEGLFRAVASRLNDIEDEHGEHFTQDVPAKHAGIAQRHARLSPEDCCDA